jgi:hypothetical protein
MERLIARKFVAMPRRRSRADRALGEESDQAIVDVTSAARRCVDDALRCGWSGSSKASVRR